MSNISSIIDFAKMSFIASNGANSSNLYLVLFVNIALDWYGEDNLYRIYSQPLDGFEKNQIGVYIMSLFKKWVNELPADNITESDRNALISSCDAVINSMSVYTDVN